jgi:hypothetical protein
MKLNENISSGHTEQKFTIAQKTFIPWLRGLHAHEQQEPYVNTRGVLKLGSVSLVITPAFNSQTLLSKEKDTGGGLGYWDKAGRSRCGAEGPGTGETPHAHQTMDNNSKK